MRRGSVRDGGGGEAWDCAGRRGGAEAWECAGRRGGVRRGSVWDGGGGEAWECFRCRGAATEAVPDGGAERKAAVPSGRPMRTASPRRDRGARRAEAKDAEELRTSPRGPGLQLPQMWDPPPTTASPTALSRG